MMDKLSSRTDLARVNRLATSSPRGVLRQLPRQRRLLLSAFVAAAGLSYGLTFVLAFLALTPPSSLVPGLGELEQSLFGYRGRQPSLVERLLEAPDGPMNRGGSMRSAFTTQSDDWERVTQTKSPAELEALEAEREAERLAVLDWVRAGAPREAYEEDEYFMSSGNTEGNIAAEFKSTGQGVRIHSIIDARCASCHRPESRNDRACWFPLDSYDGIERYCRPELVAGPSPFWSITSLVGLLPLSMLGGLLTCWTSVSRGQRLVLAILPVGAAILAMASWLGGSSGTVFFYLVVASATIAIVGLTIQAAVILHDVV
jgi:hypothetical protein